MTVLVTGAAGFIGANLVRLLLDERDEVVVGLDRASYAANARTIAELTAEAHYHHVEGDVRDVALVERLLGEQRVHAVVHLAAETHVDRSVHDPGSFVEHNLLGTYGLLEATRRHLRGRPEPAFRLLIVSTDEVYGALGETGSFDEAAPYAPRSPYAATKAGADHLARAYAHTFGLPLLVSHGCNTYGPYQHPEKLIPLLLTRALAGQTLPLYGDGRQVREWLHVEDHCRGLLAVLERGAPGRSYNLGSGEERTNVALCASLCALLDRLHPPAENPRAEVASYAELRRFVHDRPGHDFRYALDSRRAMAELSWQPRWTFEAGLEATVRWYLAHPSWLVEAADAAFESWVGQHYGEGEGEPADG